MKFSFSQESFFIHGKFVYWVLVENTSLVKVGNPISEGIVFVFTLMCKRFAKSEAILALLYTFQELHLEW